MISHLSGTVLFTSQDSITLSVSGVGYRVFTTPGFVGSVTQGDAAALYTHMAVRENAIELFGFTTPLELRFFEMLLSVSGIGPRSALAILALADPGVIIAAIQKGDSAYLTTVSGIGRKTAEKIVLELREKAALLSVEAGIAAGDADVIAALQSLGYNAQEAREALRMVPTEIEDTGKKISEALKHLAK